MHVLLAVAILLVLINFIYLCKLASNECSEWLWRTTDIAGISRLTEAWWSRRLYWWSLTTWWDWQIWVRSYIVPEVSMDRKQTGRPTWRRAVRSTSALTQRQDSSKITWPTCLQSVSRRRSPSSVSTRPCSSSRSPATRSSSLCSSKIVACVELRVSSSSTSPSTGHNFPVSPDHSLISSASCHWLE